MSRTMSPKGYKSFGFLKFDKKTNREGNFFGLKGFSLALTQAMKVDCINKLS